ncbi:glycoside hydrolase family 30 protein [Lactovum odontotermitis]
MMKTAVITTQENPWKELVLTESTSEAGENNPTLTVTDQENRDIMGFGSCFNELGMQALLKLEAEQRDQLLDELFLPEAGCSFNFCRLPIGASDYADSWYSYDEVADDFELNHFSIERDMKWIVPYVREAQKRNPDIQFMASPWSPPTWMKTKKAYNYGTLIWEEKYLKAYALYFLKYIQAYDRLGIKIAQLHIQNEVVADQKFPSCRWSGEQLRDFIRDYLGPLFEANDITTEIWLGTINAPETGTEERRNESQDYSAIAQVALFDPIAYKYIAGVGYQWAGKAAIQKTVDAFPEKRYLQTESECGNGRNTWLYAEYVFNLLRHYFRNGTNGYLYWNAVLEQGGESTWGWKQNSMVSVKAETKELIYNPEFYVMKHFSHFIQKGAKLLTLTGRDCADAVAVKNPDGTTVVVLSNQLAEAREVKLALGGQQFTLTAPAHSFCTVKLD